MVRTKQTAKKSSGGSARRVVLLPCSSPVAELEGDLTISGEDDDPTISGEDADPTISGEDSMDICQPSTHNEVILYTIY
jgi:hypothetical protein